MGRRLRRTPASFYVSEARQLSGCEREPEQVRTLNTTYTRDLRQPLGSRRATVVSHPLFTEADDTPGGTDPDTVILSYGYWQSHFGGDKSILGRGMIVESVIPWCGHTAATRASCSSCSWPAKEA